MKLSFLPWSHSRRVELWRNSPLALPAWPLRLTGPNRVVEGELRSCCWLDPGALFTETRQAGKTGVAGSPSPLTLGPVDLISPGSAGAIWRGPGEPEMSCTTHVTLRGQHGLAWFIKPGAVPPCCLIITQGLTQNPLLLHPNLTSRCHLSKWQHPFCPFVHHSFVRLFIQ